MIYRMRQKFFTLGDKYIIQDSNGRDAYQVDGRVLSLGDKLTFRDMGGRELAFMRQKLLAIGPTYEIYRNGKLQAVVKKALFTLLRHRFTVDVEGPDDLVAQGDFWDHEYVFKRRDQPVATVSKRWFSLTDTYGVEITPGEDEVLILASAVVIDLVRDNAKKQRAHAH